MKVLTVPQSGSVAGQTASRNRFGQYIRTRAIPVNPNTPSQSTVRAGFADAASLWRTLNTFQQPAWNYLALANPRVNSLGQSITLTGFQLFVGVTALLFSIGETVALSAPLGTGIGAPVLSVDDASFGSISIAFTPDPVAANHALALYSSPPQSLGTSFTNDYRFIDVLAAASASPEDISAKMAAKWGSITVGMRFFIRAQIICVSGSNKGWSSPLSNIIQLDTEP